MILNLYIFSGVIAGIYTFRMALRSMMESGMTDDIPEACFAVFMSAYFGVVGGFCSPAVLIYVLYTHQIKPKNINPNVGLRVIAGESPDSKRKRLQKEKKAAQRRIDELERELLNA